MGGCCVGNCGFCCVANCGFCCVFKCSDCGDCCVSNVPRARSCSDSPSRSIPTEQKDKIDFTAIIANEIADMRNKASNRAKSEEELILKDIDESMNEFIKWVESENKKKYDGTSLNINVDQIRKLNSDMRSEVVGFIGTQLAKRLVQGDKELAPILAERNDKLRKKNFQDFYDRVFREAIRALIKKIEEAVRKQSASIEKEIQTRLDEVNRSMNDEMKELEELQKVRSQEKAKLSDKQVEYMYYDSLCDVILNNTYIGIKKGK